MGPKNDHKVGRRVGVSTVVAIGALATGIGVAGATSGTVPSTAKTPTTIVQGRHTWDRAPVGDLGVVGTITALSASSITVQDPGGTLSTFTLTGSTVVRKDGAGSTIASLAVGENVAVMVAATGSTAAATIVVVPTTFADGPSGVVTVVSPTAITVKLPDGTVATYAIDSSTTVSEGQTSATVSAIAVGERVQVRPSTTSATTAATIEIDLAHVSGTVVSETGDTIVVSDAQGFYRTIEVGATTTYSKAGVAASLADVTVGSAIAAQGTVSTSHTVLNAISVEIGFASTDVGARREQFAGRRRAGRDRMAR